jgi:isopenicillin-N N-acyltransferase-like protein
MRFIELTGSPKEIGRQQGAAFKKEIAACYERYCISTGKTPDKLDATVPAYLEQHCPYLLEEMEGIAEGAGMRFDEILVYNHFNVVRGCTPVFMQQTDHGPILAQNLDAVAAEREALVVRIVRPNKGHAHITASFVGTVWVGTGMNAQGLAITGVSAHHRNKIYAGGTHGGIVWRDVLQQAGDVDEGFKLNCTHTYIGKIGVGILADASGTAVRVERDNETKLAIPVGEFAFSTGIFESGRIDADMPAPDSPKIPRRKTIQDLREAGNIEFSLEGMRNLLSHHCSPGPVCRHEPWQDAGVGGETQSSRIMILGARRFHITEGPPCRNDYVEYQL